MKRPHKTLLWLMLAFLGGGGFAWWLRGQLDRAGGENALTSQEASGSSLLLGARPSGLRKAESPAKDSKLAAWLAGDLNAMPQLTEAELAKYLERHGRNAESLLAASSLLEAGEAFLREAATRFPDDPRVVAAMAMRGPDEEKAAWLDQWEKLDPKNALGPLIKAGHLAKAGQREEALAALREALKRPETNSYQNEALFSAQEASVLAGHTPTEAEVIAFSKMAAPYYGNARGVEKLTSTMAKELAAAGQADAAHEVAALGLAVAQKMRQDPQLIKELVARAIEARSFTTMDSEALLGDSGQTVAQRMAELEQAKQGTKELLQETDGLLAKADEATMQLYFQRMKLLGEESAMRWLRSISAAAGQVP